MQVAIKPLHAVYRADVAYVAWRTSVLTALVVLGVLALGFWVGTSDRSYGFMAGTLLSACGYLANYGGEARLLPWLDQLNTAYPLQPARVFGLAAMLFASLFLRRYLTLDMRAPW